MKVIGIDPGLAVTGYGVIEKKEEDYYVLDYGYIDTPASWNTPRRLSAIFNNVLLLLNEFSPEAAAVEKLFFCKNIRTALQVGEARGAVLTALSERELTVYEYTPLQVKQAVVGYGKAEKKQVQKMVALLLQMQELPEPDDAADALAVALCYLQSHWWQQWIKS